MQGRIKLIIPLLNPRSVRWFSRSALCITGKTFLLPANRQPSSYAKSAYLFSQTCLLKVNELLDATQVEINCCLPDDKKPCFWTCWLRRIQHFGKRLLGMDSCIIHAQKIQWIWGVLELQHSWELYILNEFFPQTLKIFQANTPVLLPTARQQWNLLSQLESSLTATWKRTQLVTGELQNLWETAAMFKKHFWVLCAYDTNFLLIFFFTTISIYTHQHLDIFIYTWINLRSK